MHPNIHTYETECSILPPAFCAKDLSLSSAFIIPETRMTHSEGPQKSEEKVCLQFDQIGD